MVIWADVGDKLCCVISTVHLGSSVRSVFKKVKYPQNEVWDGGWRDIIKNEGGVYLGV
jgi:hypothetical protein